MKFKGTILISGEHHPITFEIKDPRPSQAAEFEREVVTDYPSRATSCLFGVDEENAQESAVAFLQTLVGEHPLFTMEGERVEFFSQTSARPHAAAGPGDLGLAISISSGKGGENVRIVMEDIQRSESGWRVQSLYTYVDLDHQTFLDFRMTERQCAELGMSIAVTLSAWMKHVPRR